MSEVAGIDQSTAVPPAGYYTRQYAAGVRIVFFDAFTGGFSTSLPLRAVLASCPQLARNAGHITGLYANVAPWQANGRVAVDGAKLIAGVEFDPAKNPYMMIDCEIGYDPNWKTYMAPFAGYDGWLREAAIKEATDYAISLGFRVISYSAAWFVNWYALHLGHVPDLCAPVVYARYDGIAAIGDPGFATLGRPVVGKQYGGSTADSTDVDLDQFDSAFFFSGGNFMAALTDLEQGEILAMARWLLTPIDWGENVDGGWFGRKGISRGEMLVTVAKYLDNGEGTLGQILAKVNAPSTPAGGGLRNGTWTQSA
jgi:hypothetical protein